MSTRSQADHLLDGEARKLASHLRYGLLASLLLEPLLQDSVQVFFSPDDQLQPALSVSEVSTVC